MVILLYFSDYSRFVPPAGGRANLVLDADTVSSVLRPFGELGCTSGCHSGLPGVEEFVSVGVEIQFAGQYREKLLDWPGKYRDGWRYLGCIPVCQHRPLEAVAV